jgi:transcriptional regulator with GAF, ATPase, and Fis domain
LAIARQIALAVDNVRAYREISVLKARLEQENAYLREAEWDREGFHEIVGRSAALQKILERVEVVARTDSTVLITGETGTGKEMIARAIHGASSRKEKSLVKVNCAALPSGFVESELFGHEKGAFTGALSRRIGRFELADGGTLFLDEVGEIPLDVQVKLLTVLQTREFERVGGVSTLKVDVRVIAATNRDLSQAIAEERFRRDLYYRLNVIPIHVPPLRERRDDIPLLVRYFVDKYAAQTGKRVTGIAPEAIQKLTAYEWPGNIRELENVVERAVILSRGTILGFEDENFGSPDRTKEQHAVETLECVERNHIAQTLLKTRGVVDGQNGAAKLLGINPSTLRSRMKKLDLQYRDISREP